MGRDDEDVAPFDLPAATISRVEGTTPTTVMAKHPGIESPWSSSVDWLTPAGLGINSGNQSDSSLEPKQINSWMRS